jgi:hypothetical protein
VSNSRAVFGRLGIALLANRLCDALALAGITLDGLLDPATLKLTVNEEKTRICRIPEGEFDFLGYTFGRMYSPRTGQAYLGYRPSRKSIKRIVEKIHVLTDFPHNQDPQETSLADQRSNTWPQ